MKLLEKTSYLVLAVIFLLALGYRGKVLGLEIVEIFNILVGLLIIFQGSWALKNSKKLGLLQLLIGLVFLLSLLGRGNFA